MKGYGLKALTLNLHKGFVGLWKNLKNFKECICDETHC